MTGGIEFTPIVITCSHLSSHVGVFMYVCMILPFVCYVMFVSISVHSSIQGIIQIRELEQEKPKFNTNPSLFVNWVWLVVDDTVQGSLISVQWGIKITHDSLNMNVSAISVRFHSLGIA